MKSQSPFPLTPCQPYEHFEDLPVWRDAIKLAEGCENFLLTAKSNITWSKRDQLDRCSLSVSNNIAEGFERGSTNELLAFLYIARGSAGKTRSMLCFFERRPLLRDFKSPNLKSIAESCSRQLRAWADSLQKSDIKGQRHLNNRVRRDLLQKDAAQSWEKKAMAMLPPDHPARTAWEKKNGPLE